MTFKSGAERENRQSRSGMPSQMFGAANVKERQHEVERIGETCRGCLLLM